MMRRHSALMFPAAAFLVSLLTSCGDIGHGVSVHSQSTSDDAARAQASCVVRPATVELNSDYLVLGSGLAKRRYHILKVEDGAGTTSVDVMTDGDGAFTLTATGRAVGSGLVSVFAPGKRHDRLQTTCSFEVVGPTACGDGSCDSGEDCASCAADCGACPPS